jgi:hypothetical protein
VRNLNLFDDINKQATAIMNSGKKIKDDAAKIRDTLTESLEGVRKAIARGLEPDKLEPATQLELTNESATEDEGEEA